MARQYSYTDAARLLGAPSSFLKLLDQITAVGLLGGSVVAPTPMLSLFGARSEAIRTCQTLITSLNKKLKQKHQADRTELLKAAHSIIVLTAYFEVFGECSLPVSLDDLELTKREQLLLAHGNISIVESRRSIVDMIASTEIPTPSPVAPYETTRNEIEKFYKRLSGHLVQFISGLYFWDQLDNAERVILNRGTAGLAGLALEKYDVLFRQLAADFPVFFIWANLRDHQATREAILMADQAQHGRLRELYEAVDVIHTGLAGIEKMLRYSGFGNPEYARSHLAIMCRAELDWPIIDRKVLKAQPQIEFPNLMDGYVNPGARISVINEFSQPGEESWWNNISIIEDIQISLAGLISMTDSPVIVLGQPGAGKSLLTRVLAARSAETGVLALRIELRHVPADSSIQRQIEEGIYRLLGERVAWPELVRQAGEAPRLILLDGLDELIQTSRVERADYLELVEDFQKHENAIGRPTCVIVTSRLMVAGKARFPENSVVVRLEPFSDSQIQLWLDRWNLVNQKFFKSTGLNPLLSNHAIRQGDLARQPLLLQMLALYDADSNGLQKTTMGLASADLYEGLLEQFARREVLSRDNHTRGSASETTNRAVEREFQRLSVIACGMFNRSRQWVSLEEITLDFDTLLVSRPPDHARMTTSRFQEYISEADVTIGRFFFVQESRLHGTITRRTYEFLHPTFGEYLVARLAIRATRDYSDQLKLAETSSALGYSPTDDGLLFSILSFELLAARSHVFRFIGEMLKDLLDEEKRRIRMALSELFRNSLRYRMGRGFVNYLPEDREFTYRAAVYSANLLLLIVSLAEGPVSSSEIFGKGVDSVRAWRQRAMLWNSQFGDRPDWGIFVDFFSVTRDYLSDGSRHILLARRADNQLAPLDLSWSFGEDRRLPRDERENEEPYYQIGPVRVSCGELFFLVDPRIDLLLDMVAPILGQGGFVGTAIVGSIDGPRVETAIGALINLLVTSAQDRTDDLVGAYRRCFMICQMDNFPGVDVLSVLIRRLFEADAYRLPSEFIDEWTQMNQK